MHYPNLCAFVVVVFVGCKLHAPGTKNLFDVRSSSANKFWARGSKLGSWVDLDMVYLSPYDLMGWSAVWTCSARARVLYLLLFYRPYTGHTYTTPTCVLFWLPFLWCAGCSRQNRKTLLRGSSGSGKFWASDDKFGTLMELNMRISMVHCIWWWGA